MSDLYEDFLKLALPEVLVEYFDLVNSNKKDEVLHLFFEEFNTPPNVDNKTQIIAHGFHKEVIIEDFPIRGNKVYLHVKRRRWLNKETKTIIQRDWELVAKGTRMTTEFSSFLKEINRYT